MKQTKPRVAVITGKDDAHLPFVGRHLTVPPIMLDVRELAAGKALTYRLEGDTVAVRYGDDDLNDIAGVWYRKPQAIPQAELDLDPAYQEYSADAMKQHGAFLLTAFRDATWVSDYYAIVRASDKSLQLATARRLGFRVPDTVTTSDPTAAAAFIAKHPRCISKPLTPTHPVLNSAQHILLTTLITKDNMPDLTNLYAAPSIFQEAVDVAYDLRVTVVGGKVFPAKMTSGVERSGTYGPIRDNRLGNMQLAVAGEFPREIAEKCIAHVKALGLNFGAIDLLVDKKGVYWFLENNPNGQWAFVEQATGLPIGRAIAELLERRPGLVFP